MRRPRPRSRCRRWSADPASGTTCRRPRRRPGARPATVITLFVDPGSYTSTTGRLRWSAGAGRAGWSGVGALDVRHREDVAGRTSTTIAMPPFAFALPTSSASTCSDWYWRPWSIVSTRSLPRCDCATLLLTARELSSLRVELDLELAPLAGQLAVVLGLQPAEPAVVGPDEAEQRAGERAVRVEALRLGDEVDAAERQRLHLQRGRAVDLAGDVHESLVVLRQPVAQRRLVAADDRRELRGVGGGVGHDARIRPHRLLGHGRGEVVAVPVEHAAALGGELDLAHALIEPELCVSVPPDRLEVDEAGAHDEEDEDESGEKSDQATMGRPLSRPPRTELRPALPAPCLMSLELLVCNPARRARRTPHERHEDGPARRARGRRPAHRFRAGGATSRLDARSCRLRGPPGRIRRACASFLPGPRARSGAGGAGRTPEPRELPAPELHPAGAGHARVTAGCQGGASPSSTRPGAWWRSGPARGWRPARRAR